MIYPCNFKSKVKVLQENEDHRGCMITPDRITCPGEQNCILYQLYALANGQSIEPDTAECAEATQQKKTESQEEQIS